MRVSLENVLVVQGISNGNFEETTWENYEKILHSTPEDIFESIAEGNFNWITFWWNFWRKPSYPTEALSKALWELSGRITRGILIDMCFLLSLIFQTWVQQISFFQTLSRYQPKSSRSGLLRFIIWHLDY